MHDSDDALILRYREGDLDAFELLYDRYAPRLLGFMISLGADAETARDLAQRAWLRVVERVQDYEPRGRFRSWLFRVGHRLWLDEVRSAWRRKRVPLDMESDESARAQSNGFRAMADSGPTPLEAALENERRESVEQALRQLPEPLRQTVLLRIDADLSYREIGQAMGCPIGTALWRAAEARRRLKDILCARSEEKTR